MEKKPGRRFSRRSLLKLGLGFLATYIASQIGCRYLKVPSDVFASPQDRSSTGPRESVVAIVRGEDPRTMVRQAVAQAGGLGQVVRPGTTVLVKPNLTIPSASGKGNVTDWRIVQWVIELCREAGAGRILVGDGSGGGDPHQIMRQAGYEQVLIATGATFVDLNRDEIVTRRLADPAGLAEYHLSKTAVDAPVLISLAVLKVHNSAVISLACKNLMGITARQVYGTPRMQLHEAGVQRVTADIVRLRPPSFSIIDGTVGLEGDSPLYGTPVPMNLVIAGRNPVNVDAVGAVVMGFDPAKIEQLTILAAKGLGEIDLSKITVVGATVAQVQRKFQRKQ